MKVNLRLGYKLFLITLLFINGLIITAGIFPVVNFMSTVANAKIKQDALKILWLGWFSAIVKLQISKEGEIPKQGILLVSNHISWLDIIVIGQYLPAYFVAKNDISSWPVIGYLARQGGTIFIRRGDKQHLSLIHI